jgi:hypothetical protein
MNIEQQLQLNALFEDAPPMASKKVAVVIGRFNPPTKGHYAVINEVRKFIKSHPKLGLESNPVVVVVGGSKSDLDKKRNPLTVDERILFMSSSGQANGVIFFTAKNAFEALTVPRQNGFEPIAVAAGSDRIDDYIKILDKHFKTPDDKPIEHLAIKLQRDDSAVETGKEEKQAAMDKALKSAASGEDLETDIISGSLARRAVELGYEEEFAKIVGLEGKPVLAKKMFKKIKDAISE